PLSTLRSGSNQDATNLTAKIQALLCYSELRDGKWQPTRTSDLHHPLDLGAFPPSGKGAFNRKDLKLHVVLQRDVDPNSEDTGLLLMISGPGVTFGWFTLYNTHSNPEPNGQVTTVPNLFSSTYRTMDTDSSTTFKITYDQYYTNFTGGEDTEVG